MRKRVLAFIAGIFFFLGYLPTYYFAVEPKADVDGKLQPNYKFGPAIKRESQETQDRIAKALRVIHSPLHWLDRHIRTSFWNPSPEE